MWIPFALIGEYVSFYAEQEYVQIDDDDLAIMSESGSFVDTIREQPPISAGVVLGLHNIYICIPQFLSTLVSMIIFSFVEDDPYGTCIRTGGIAMFLAGLLALKTTQLDCKND